MSRLGPSGNDLSSDRNDARGPFYFLKLLKHLFSLTFKCSGCASSIPFPLCYFSFMSYGFLLSLVYSMSCSSEAHDVAFMMLPLSSSGFGAESLNTTSIKEMQHGHV